MALKGWSQLLTRNNGEGTLTLSTFSACFDHVNQIDALSDHIKGVSNDNYRKIKVLENLKKSLLSCVKTKETRFTISFKESCISTKCPEGL